MLRAWEDEEEETAPLCQEGANKIMIQFSFGIFQPPTAPPLGTQEQRLDYINSYTAVAVTLDRTNRSRYERGVSVKEGGVHSLGPARQHWNQPPTLTLWASLTAQW